MATRQQADDIIDAWLQSSVGKKFDPDGQYKLQCVDTIDAYGEALFGVRWQDSVGGVAGAKDLMGVAPAKYWEKVYNDPDNETLLPRRGDVIVWAGNPDDYYTKWGHTAVVESATHTGVHVLQQDGFAPPLVQTPDGTFSDKPVHRAYLNWWNPGTGMVAGWLRPRPEMIQTRGQHMPKQYKHITSYTAENTSPRSFFGYPDKPTAITVHHWGSMGQDFHDVCRYLASVSDDTSAHTVLQDGLIATLAVPEVATWHSGNAAGNGSSIGVECRPEMTPGDVDTLVQYVYELEQTYGSMTIYFHKEWFATACPGKYEAIRDDVIARVNTMHGNGGVDPRLSTKPAKVTQQAEKVVPIKPKPAEPKAARELNPDGWAVWAYRNHEIEDRDAYAILRGLAKDVQAIKADVADMKESA